jgi:hypothetical protein
LGKSGHFGNAAGIVGHRTEGIERNDHAGNAEHGGDGDRRAEKASELIGRDDAADDDDAGSAVDSSETAKALDDVGAVTGDRRLGDGIDRALVGAGVILGDHHDQTPSPRGRPGRR